MRASFTVQATRDVVGFHYVSFITNDVGIYVGYFHKMTGEGGEKTATNVSFLSVSN